MPHKSDPTEQQRRKELEGKLHYVASLNNLGKIAGSIAHEINNCLFIIFGHLQRLKSISSTNDQEKTSIEPSIKIIDSNSTRIALLVKTLLAHSTSNDNEKFEVMSLEKILDQALTFFKSRLKTDEVEVDITGFSGDINLFCQESKILHLFMNIISTAIEDLQDAAKKRIRISALKSETTLELKIADNGRKISEEVQSHFILPLNIIEGMERTLGLELSAAKGIVESYQGSLEFARTSEESVFTIIFPLHSPNVAQ